MLKLNKFTYGRVISGCVYTIRRTRNKVFLKNNVTDIQKFIGKISAVHLTRFLIFFLSYLLEKNPSKHLLFM